MKNLISTLFLGAGLAFNSYSQAFEKTNGQMKQYNEKGQIIKACKKCPEYGLQNLHCYESVYDSLGNKIKEIHKLDEENDGKFDYVSQWNYAYDKKGNLIVESFKIDEENDGKFDYATKLINVYDGQGRKIERIRMIDRENDGKPEVIGIDEDNDGYFEIVKGSLK